MMSLGLIPRNFSMNFSFILLVLFLSSCGGERVANKETAEEGDKVADHFDDLAKNCDLTKPLYLCSEWYASTQEEWDARVTTSFAKLDPPLRDNESIFELGVGVGAVVQTLMKQHKGLWIGGSDLSKQALEIAKKVFPSQADHFFVNDMTKKHSYIPDNSFHHVVSLGALAQYLDKEQMLVAIEEAARMTTPGGSMLFTNFMEATEPPSKYVHERVPKSFWRGKLEKFGIENVKIHNMPTKGRYEISCTKKKDKRI